MNDVLNSVVAKKFYVYSLDNNLVKQVKFKNIFDRIVKNNKILFDWLGGLNHAQVYNVRIHWSVLSTINCLAKEPLNTVMAIIKKTNYSDDIVVENTYGYAPNSPNRKVLFFNKHFYSNFLTKENIRSYVLFVLNPTMKITYLHALVFAQLFNEFMQNEMENIYEFILHDLKTIGVLLEDKYSFENAHGLLCDFPLYADFLEKEYSKRKMEFVLVCEFVYDNYDDAVVGNRVVVDEVVIRAVYNFL